MSGVIMRVIKLSGVYWMGELYYVVVIERYLSFVFVFVCCLKEYVIIFDFWVG